jgi:hypothetical protein
MKIMHINHSLNCTILNLQFVPVRRLYRLRVNRFSKPGTSSSFTAKLSRPLKQWTIRYLERTSGHNEAALRKHGRSLSRQRVKTINFVSNANLTLWEKRDDVFGTAARRGAWTFEVRVLPGGQIPPRPTLQCGYKDHAASCAIAIGTTALSQQLSGDGVKLATRLHLVPKLE